MTRLWCHFTWRAPVIFSQRNGIASGA